MGETPDAGGATGLVSSHRHSSALDSNTKMSASWVEGVLVPRL